MLDHIELRKYFTKSQQQDMIDLDINCMQTPPGRIRRTRIRKVKPDHIPRPVNSFMSYRTEKQSIIRQFCPTANHRDISKMVAKWWHNVGSLEKDIYIEKAKAAKDAHSEQYPDYIFRPKAKRTKKNIIKNVDLISHTQDGTYGNSSARTRPFIKPVKAVKSHLIQSNVSNESYMFTPLDNNAIYNTEYNNDVVYNDSNMYNDEVLFQTKEDAASTSDFWGAYQSSEQVMSNSFPGLIEIQNANFRPSYYPSPHHSAVSPNTSPLGHVHMHIIDPLITMISNNSFSYDNPYDLASFTNNSKGGCFNHDGQLFSHFDYEVTPQSQVMSIPRLNYPNSPASPYFDISTLFENQRNMKCRQKLEEKISDYQSNSMFENSLPTDGLSPSITANDDFVFSWSNNSGVKYESTTLLGDCDFWGNSII